MCCSGRFPGHRQFGSQIKYANHVLHTGLMYRGVLYVRRLPLLRIALIICANQSCTVTYCIETLSALINSPKSEVSQNQQRADEDGRSPAAPHGCIRSVVY